MIVIYLICALLTVSQPAKTSGKEGKTIDHAVVT
jgi:hypothetical protein